MEWAGELGAVIAEATYEEKRYLLWRLKARMVCYWGDHDPDVVVKWALAGLREVYHLLPKLTDKHSAAVCETHNSLSLRRSCGQVRASASSTPCSPRGAPRTGSGLGAKQDV